MDANFTCKRDPKRPLSYFLEDLDGFRCALATMGLILYNINFGIICYMLLLLIAIISIFGRIKEHYRWFILNQVILDALLSYNFVCDNAVGHNFYHRDICRWDNSIFDGMLDDVAVAAYSSVMLLSLSRFLCLYFKNFYEKLTKGKRIFVTIFVYNFVIVITTLDGLFTGIQQHILFNIACTQDDVDEMWACFDNPPYDLTVIKLIRRFQGVTGQIKPPLCLLISIFSTIMIIAKISKQFKFQKSNNIKDFYISLRITVVIAFQTLLYFLLFWIEWPQNLFVILHEFDPNFSQWNDLPIGKWYWGQYGIAWSSIIQNFIQIRIFIECIIILFIMSGYREAVIQFLKFLFAFFGFKFDGKNNKTPVIVLQNSRNVLVDTQILS